MTEEIAKKLEETHTHLQHASYFECQDGWSDIIDVLYGQLPKGTKIDQIKEKFGLLRVYTSLPENLLAIDWGRAQGAIATAEAMSGRICEDCGQPGRRDTSKKGWIRTLCEKHRAEREKNT